VITLRKLEVLLTFMEVNNLARASEMLGQSAVSVHRSLHSLEEGLRCRELAFVIGEISGNPRALDLTASRRLGLAAEKHAVPLLLVRLSAQRDLSSARQRWSVQAAPSPAPRWNPAAPGTASWRAELFRARRHPPGTWILRDDGVLVAERSAATVASEAGMAPRLARSAQVYLPQFRASRAS